MTSDSIVALAEDHDADGVSRRPAEVLEGLDKEALLKTLTSELIEVVAQIDNSKSGVTISRCIGASISQPSTCAHEQIGAIFADLQKLIQVNELPPRFIAALDDSYQRATGKFLKSDLASSARAYDQLYQTAIDVASSATKGSCSA